MHRVPSVVVSTESLSPSSSPPPVIVVLSPQQIEARLQDRFRLLTGGSRTAINGIERSRLFVDWSYELLSVAERQCSAG